MEIIEGSAQRAEMLLAKTAALEPAEADLALGRWSLASSRDVARSLKATGLREGEVIALWMTQGEQRARLMLGAAQLGIWAVPIHPAEPLLSVRRILRAWKVRLLVVPQENAGYDYVVAAEALKEVHPELRWAALSDFNVLNDNDNDNAKDGPASRGQAGAA